MPRKRRPKKVLEIFRMGHPVLRARARELAKKEIFSDEVQRLIDLMIPTMREADGIGLAAPQVGAPIRLTVVEIPEKSGRCADAERFSLGVFINPKITVLDRKKQGFWEGCLSVPGLRGFVERPVKIRVEYLDRAAKPYRITVSGFLATVFQHEFDHLNGVLFIDRVRDTRELAFIEEFEQFHQPAEKEPVES